MFITKVIGVSMCACAHARARALQDNLLSPARKAEDPGVWLLYQSVAPHGYIKLMYNQNLQLTYLFYNQVVSTRARARTRALHRPFPHTGQNFGDLIKKMCF